MKSVIEKAGKSASGQGEVTSLKSRKKKQKTVCGVRTRLGENWSCQAVIIATGTYLRGRIFVGDVNYPGGPDGSLPADGLTDSLAGLGVALMRFKTGTPARVNRRSIDFSALPEQPGERPVTPYSALTTENLDAIEQLPCHIFTKMRNSPLILEHKPFGNVFRKNSRNGAALLPVN